MSPANLSPIRTPRSLEECLRNEYRAAMRMTTKADGHFFEGVRAFVVDRDNKVRATRFVCQHSRMCLSGHEKATSGRRETSVLPCLPVVLTPHHSTVCFFYLHQPAWARRTLADVTTAEIDAIVAPFADKKEELTVTKDPYVCSFFCHGTISDVYVYIVLRTGFVECFVFSITCVSFCLMCALNFLCCVSSRARRYAEIFHETYNNWESMQKDTQTFIGGSVPVGRDWDRAATNLRMPRAPKPGQTGNIGRSIGW